MHAGGREPLERGIRLVGVVDGARHDDRRGAVFEQVKIVASGGFTIEKIREFEEKGVPVDAYGVGSSLIRGSNDFTGDIVLTDGKPTAKFGRRQRPNPRLELVTRDASSGTSTRRSTSCRRTASSRSRMRSPQSTR